MKQILQTVWRTDKKNFLLILLLNIGVALTGSVSIVMLVPMLDLLDISVGDGSSLSVLLEPFMGMSYLQRAIVLIMVYVLLMLINAILTARFSVRQSAYLGRYEMNLRKDIYCAISTVDWEVLSGKTGTDLIQLVTVHCKQARYSLQLVIALISSVFSALLQLAIAVWMSPPVTLLVLVVGASFLLVFRPAQKKSRELGEQSVKAGHKLHREIQNQLNGIKEIRAYGAEEHHAALFQDISQEHYDISVHTTRVWVIPRACYSVAAAILIGMAFVFSVLILDTGTAQLVVLVYIFSRLWPIFSSWQGQVQDIQTYVPSYEVVQTVINEFAQNIREPEKRDEALSFVNEVSFNDVHFAYRNSTEDVLKGMNFTLPFGSVTALVGPSGAGKSTTADLLLGLLRPTKGCIDVDGQALNDDTLGAWRKMIGYIPQEPLILNTTVRENLQRFHPDATEEEMVDALKRSLAWPVIEKLPLGLDTVLGDKGVRLSGGERQRIVLARVLMGNPKLIILDEATSALDYASENFVRETIQSLRKHTTVLIIAHRMATIRGADRAIVLLDGKIAEQGSMQELLQKEDSYLAKMVSVE